MFVVIIYLVVFRIIGIGWVVVMGWIGLIVGFGVGGVVLVFGWLL